MKKKKVVIAILSSSTVLFLILMVILISIAMAIMSGSDYTKERREKDNEASIEHFEIKGKKTGNTHTLNFIFSSWKIENIKTELVGTSGELKTKVKMPGISGSYEAIAYQVLRQAGYSHAGTCGIMGNIWAESGGFDPCAIEGENSWTSGKSNRARGYGFCQWTNTTPPYTHGRRTNVINWLKKNGYDPYKKSNKLAIGQLKYMLQEPGYDNVRAKVKRAKNIENATEDWLRGFEGIFNISTFRIRRKKAFEYSKRFTGYNKKNSGNKRNVALNISFSIKGSHVTFVGKLDGTSIAGYYDINNGNISGSGEYGEGATSGEKGGFAGTLSGANIKQKKVVLAALSYHDPYHEGFPHMCELWVYTVFKKAGLNYNGSCCASHSRDKNATTKGKIPIGAAIYSGGSYHSSVHCGCGRNAGHVAIYVGNNMVAGSQSPFKMTLSQWKSIFGYGGWYFPRS